MKNHWAKKVKNSDVIVAGGFLAPEWYMALKQSQASQKEVFEAVRAYCMETMPHQSIDDDFVELMVATYEA